MLADDLAAELSINASITSASADRASLQIQRTPNSGRDESYRMSILPTGITVHAPDSAGAYYAVQTLRELVRYYGRRLPCMRIDDYPDFERRGVSLDCARGKVPTVKTLKSLIERLGAWKINELQLYIKNSFTWSEHPDIGTGFSRFTPDEIRSLNGYAKKHHIRLVPYLASFSHMELILALPQYAHLAELPGAMGWSNGTCLNPKHPGSIKLIDELYAEFLPLFDADDFNVGCDETWELGRGKSKNTAKKIGTGTVYLDFLLKLHKLCDKYGKRLNAWGDIVLKYPELIPKLPNDMMMLNWDYGAKGSRMGRTEEFARADIPVMACPGTSGWTVHGSNLKNAMGNIRNFVAIGRKHGAKGVLNTDWGDYAHRNFTGPILHTLAYGAAHSWNGRGVKESGFTERFFAHFVGTPALAMDYKMLGEVAAILQSHKASPASLYHSLVEPIEGKHTRFADQLDPISTTWHYPEYFPATIDKTPRTALEEIIEKLNGVNFDIELPKQCSFEKLALDEMQTAVEMDILAARRSILAQDLRSGTSVKSATLKNWAEDMTRCTREFKRLWMARNKSLRLSDNLELMKLATKECVDLARR